MNYRAQISNEFFALLGLAFLISIAFEVVALDQLNDFRIKKENEAVQDMALKLQREMLLAAVVEDGYVRSFTIPDKLDGINYTLTTMNSTLSVQSKNSYYSASIPKSVGNITKGTNRITRCFFALFVFSFVPFVVRSRYALPYGSVKVRSNRVELCVELPRFLFVVGL